MDGGASISDDGVYRYKLWRRWAAGDSLLWVMLNPSTADAAVNDATIRRVIGFSRAWGYGASVVVNLFALRSTAPAALGGHADPVGPHNDAVIASEAMAHRDILVAWGAATGRYVGDRARQVSGGPLAGRRLLCLGNTGATRPRHPLYAAGGVQPVGFLGCTLPRP